MKTTDFLKKYSDIDKNFIDDFYVFYDEEQNEYDFTIDLDKLAYWLEIRKDHLKRLLLANFIEKKDYIEVKPSQKLAGIGKNNIKIVLLTYECSKLLTMISKCKKADIIRRYYIEIEKLIIKYKDNIVSELNRQIGIKNKNKTIIKKNNNKWLIYILKVSDDIYKLGKTKNLKNRMKQYKVGHPNELEIVFIYKSNIINDIEKCVKLNLKDYEFIKGTELYKIDKLLLKDTIKFCEKTRNSLNNNDLQNSNWIVILKNIHANKKITKKNLLKNKLSTKNYYNKSIKV